MISSTRRRCGDLLAERRAETEHLPTEADPHLQGPPRHDVVERAHALEQGDVLEGARHSRSGGEVGRHLAARDALPADLALLRPIEAVDDIEHRRLAGPVRPDDRADLARPDVEADLGQGAHAAEAQRDVVDGEQDLADRPRRAPSAARYISGLPGAAQCRGSRDRPRSAPCGRPRRSPRSRPARAAGPRRSPRSAAMALVDHAAAHLAGAGQLAVVGVELLVEREEAADSLRLGQHGIDLLDLVGRAARRRADGPRGSGSW